MRLSRRIWTIRHPASALAVVTALLGVATAFADDEVVPAPPSIGADVPVTYFGPPPSSVEPELIGPLQLLRSGQIDFDAGTITLPLYRGQMMNTDESVWFIVTDTTDEGNAIALGLNHSPKLEYADTCRGVRRAIQEQDASLTFDHGTVDFSPERIVVPGQNAPFPPSEFQPGSVGDEFYSPLVRILNAGNHVYNAPTVASDVSEEELNEMCDGNVDHAVVHDSVTAICPRDGTVTLALVPGFSFAKPVLYLSTESNMELPAALEGATFAPALQDVAVGRDDSAFSAVERIFAMINGPTNVVAGERNPQRQGFTSALRAEGGPLNVLGGIPTVATDYSPLWDLNLGEWTEAAIANGYRSRVTEEFQILGLVQRGFITGPNGAPYGSSGIIVNCPIVHRFL